MAINHRTSDYELVEKLQKGDLEAFDQIFNKYSGRLFGFALKYLKSKEESEGLVQDVFLKVWEIRKKIKPDLSLKSYLFTIAYHNMCRIFRKRQIYLKLVEKSKVGGNPAVDLENQTEYKDILEQVDKLINKLPQKQKEILIKRSKNGKNNREIAEEMNLAPGTINNNISAALKFLKYNLSSEDIAL